MLRGEGKAMAAVLFSHCAIVIVLLAVAPWIDWARHGSAWVLNLAALPVLPGVFMVLRRRRLEQERYFEPDGWMGA